MLLRVCILRLFRKSAKLSSSESNVANTGGNFSYLAGDSGLSGVEVCTGWQRSQATDTERSGTGGGLNVVVSPIFSSSKLAFDGDTKNSASFSRRGLAGAGGETVREFCLWLTLSDSAPGDG